MLLVHRDTEVMEKTVQDKNLEIRQLQKENAELERAKHTEVVKLRLEVSVKYTTVITHVYYTYIHSMMLKCWSCRNKILVRKVLNHRL